MTVDTDSTVNEPVLQPELEGKCAAAPAPADGMEEGLQNGTRERKQPKRFEPEEFWRRELPEFAQDSGTQKERAVARAKQRDDELEAMQAEWLKKGQEHADKLVKTHPGEAREDCFSPRCREGSTEEGECCSIGL